MLFLEIDSMDIPKPGEEDKIAKKQSSLHHLTSLLERYHLATFQPVFVRFLYELSSQNGVVVFLSLTSYTPVALIMSG